MFFNQFFNILACYIILWFKFAVNSLVLYLLCFVHPFHSWIIQWFCWYFSNWRREVRNTTTASLFTYNIRSFWVLISLVKVTCFRSRSTWRMKILFIFLWKSMMTIESLLNFLLFRGIFIRYLLQFALHWHLSQCFLSSFP